MDSIRSFFQTTDFKGLIQAKATEAWEKGYEYVSTPTTEKVTHSLELFGLGSAVYGAVNFAMDKKSKGLKAIILGTASAAVAPALRALSECYQSEKRSFFGAKTPILNVADRIICSPEEITENIKSKAIEKTPDYLYGAGLATAAGGMVDFVRGNKKRGTAFTLMGSAAALASYYIKA